MKHPILGTFSELEILRDTPHGLFLDALDLGDVLLPGTSIPKNFEIGDKIRVFVYKDSEDRNVATTEIPYAEVGQFAYLKIKEVNTQGAFADWGLMKDLLVPYREQKVPMEADKRYWVYVYIDFETFRIVGSSKVGKFIEKAPLDFSTKEMLSMKIYATHEKGYRVLVDNKFLGMLYQNQIFRKLRIGETVKGYLHKVTEEGRLDMRLQAEGYSSQIPAIAEQIKQRLIFEGGFLQLNDITPAEVIYKEFGISKKNFKKAIGLLLKEGVLSQDSEGIRLILPS